MGGSIHDNHLVAYEVDSQARRIILRTEYAYGEEPFESTEVIFGGVLDHHFRNPRMPAIIFDVIEIDPRVIIERDKCLIDSGHKIGGWPSFWRDTVDAMVDAIASAGCKMFEISSSYGLDGWVAAESCEFRQGSKSQG
ncbi:conserved hypothetical protein [Haloferula helveola]|uniref:Uncharacterized protein n=1 Tax=Haloferula helveola TaxID=490095 RepID=A0ABM7RF04_9BACT|nr:conserved hypothetical protein [Haloferula helveola]